MMRRALLVLLTLSACGTVGAKGDRLVTEGRYDDAIDAYDKEATKPLTRTEHYKVAEGRRDAYRAKLRAEFETVMSSSMAPSQKRSRLAEIYALAFSQADSPELAAELEAAAVAVSTTEFDAITAQIASGQVEVGLDALLALSKEIIASSRANERVLELRRFAADTLRAKAQAESDATRTLLETWAATIDYVDWPASARPYFLPEVQLSGTLAPCDRRVPIDSAADGVPVSLQWNCRSGVNVEQATEQYQYADLEEYVATRKVCRTVQTGYESKKVQYERKIYDGVYGDVWEYGVKTVRGKPTYGSSCSNEEYIAQQEVVRTATRTFDVRKFWVGLDGTLIAHLPNGPVTKTLDTNRIAEQRAIPTAPDSAESRFSNTQQEALDVFQDDLPELYRRLVLGMVREALEEDANRMLDRARSAGDRGMARDAAARVALYGGEIPDELADLGFQTGAKPRWFSSRDAEFLVVEQVEFKRAYGQSAERFDIGASFIETDFRVRHTQLRDLSNQPGRDSVMFEFGQTFSPLAQLALRDAMWPFGFVFHDEIGYRIAMGRRISSPYLYPTKQSSIHELEERGGAQSAGVHAQLVAGYRGKRIGLLAGARGRADTQRVGDAANGSTGVPFVVRLELRPHVRYPIVLEAWGFSLLNDKEAMGASATFAVSNVINIALDADIQHGATRIRGIHSADLVDLGRRPSYNFGISLQLAGMFGDL